MRNENRFGLGSKLLLSNALSMLNKNLTGFVQSLFSVQSICTARKGSASRVVHLHIIIYIMPTNTQTQVCNMLVKILHTSAQQVFTHRIYFNHCCISFNEQIIKSHHPVRCLIQASFTETHFPGKLQGI